MPVNIKIIRRENEKKMSVTIKIADVTNIYIYIYILSCNYDPLIVNKSKVNE